MKQQLKTYTYVDQVVLEVITLQVMDLQQVRLITM